MKLKTINLYDKFPLSRRVRNSKNVKNRKIKLIYIRMKLETIFYYEARDVGALQRM